ncbi:MAG: single-stranded DNA-binding protein [Acidimicrobiales bacterium]
MDTNTVTVVGNITREPELRYSNAGRGFAGFGLAVNRRWQNRQTQEWEEQTSFFEVSCFGDMAENVAGSCPKGARVVVVGRLNQDRWETAEGDSRSAVKIMADEVAPSLRFASAEIHKIDRRHSDQAPVPAAAAATPASTAGEEPF